MHQPLELQRAEPWPHTNFSSERQTLQIGAIVVRRVMELPSEPPISGAGRSTPCGGWRPHGSFVLLPCFNITIIISISSIIIIPSILILIIVTILIRISSIIILIIVTILISIGSIIISIIIIVVVISISISIINISSAESSSTALRPTAIIIISITISIGIISEAPIYNP